MRMAFLLVVATIGLVARGTMGCAASHDEPSMIEDAASPPPEASSVDATADDADTRDAASDARETCSVDGWCHTPLPLDEVAAIDPLAVSIDLRDVWVMPNHDAWAVADQGYVLHFTGGAWHLAFHANAPLHSVWASSSSDVWTAGADGLVLHGTEIAGTLTFEKVDLGSVEPIVRVWGTSPSDVWVVTRQNVYRKVGASFSPVAFPLGTWQKAVTRYITDVWGLGGELWIGVHEYTPCEGPDDDGCHDGTRSSLARWRGVVAEPDAGPNALWESVPFETMPQNVGNAINAGTLTPDGTHFLMLAITTDTRVVRLSPDDAGDYADAGSRTELRIPSTMQIRATFAAAQNDVWAVGWSGVQHWNGESWNIGRLSITNSPVGNRLHAIRGVVDATGKSDIWIVGNDIAMRRSVAR